MFAQQYAFPSTVACSAVSVNHTWFGTAAGQALLARLLVGFDVEPLDDD